jgi:hypothetical protein
MPTASSNAGLKDNAISLVASTGFGSRIQSIIFRTLFECAHNSVVLFPQKHTLVWKIGTKLPFLVEVIFDPQLENANYDTLKDWPI